jgi:hypothetical protein
MQSRKSNKKSPALWLDSPEAVVASAGNDYEVAAEPSAARAPCPVRFPLRALLGKETPPGENESDRI